MTQTDERTTSAKYRAARTTSLVAGVFSGIFAALLIVNLIGSAVIGPARENELAAMKAQVLEEPGNEELVAEIRALDLEIRRNRIWRLDFSRKASYMLLASVVLFLIAAKLASDMSEEPPRPEHLAERGEAQVQEAKQSRWAVAGGLAVLAVGMAGIWMSGSVEFVQAEEAKPTFATLQEKREQWHRFRGPAGAGVSAYVSVPASWNGETGENILWKTPVPLPGRSSPILWEDRIFVTGATEEDREVYCFDANSGTLLWKGDVPTTPAAAQAELHIMEDTGHAACTPATDGERVFAIFATGDIAGFDFNGRRLWHRNLGVPESAYGYATSLDTYNNLVLIQYDQGYGDEGKSRVYALDALSGRTVWEAKREEIPNSWTTPIVISVDGQDQLITVADPWVIAYDPADGQEIWRVECVGGDVAPAPIYAGGLVMAIEPYAQVVAIKPTGKGNVTETHIAWRMEEGAPDICSPVSNGEYVYLMESEGYMLCCKVADGTLAFEHDLKASFRASPSVVGDKLYNLSMEGVMHIGQIGPEYKELGRAELGENCYASPIFADGRIYIRADENLYGIGQK